MSDPAITELLNRCQAAETELGHTRLLLRAADLETAKANALIDDLRHERNVLQKICAERFDALAIAESERDSALKRAEEAERERDEARAELAQREPRFGPGEREPTRQEILDQARKILESENGS